MILQTLDIEENCYGLFYKGEIYPEHYYEKIMDECQIAWKYSPSIDNRDQEFLYLLLRGEDILLGSQPTEKYTAARNRLLAQKRALSSMGPEILSEVCFYDMIPKSQLVDYLTERSKILESAYSSLKVGKDYDILYKAHLLASKISSQKLKFSSTVVRDKIKYNIFGTSTGRFTTEGDSFPILTMKKSDRHKLKPHNDLFVEFDINGAEARTLLALMVAPQPEGDIHEWNMLQLPPWFTRQEAKSSFFAWLYNPKSENSEMSKIYDRDIYKKYCNSGVLSTPFGREIEVEEKKKLNYLIQSTTSDIVVDRAYRIMNHLSRKKSFISFTMHDSVVLDFSKQEFGLIEEIKNIFENNKLGRFPCNLSVGLNFGNLKKVEI